MRVIAENIGRVRSDTYTIFEAGGLPTLFSQSDFVVVAVAPTPQTRKMVGKAELRVMKPTAYLTNVARGPIVNQEALIHAC